MNNNEKINEYKNLIVLSERARDFLYNGDYVAIPDDIRLEFENFIKNFDLDKTNEELCLKIENRFRNIFKS